MIAILMACSGDTTGPDGATTTQLDTVTGGEVGGDIGEPSDWLPLDGERTNRLERKVGDFAAVQRLEVHSFGTEDNRGRIQREWIAQPDEESGTPGLDFNIYWLNDEAGLYLAGWYDSISISDGDLTEPVPVLPVGAQLGDVYTSERVDGEFTVSLLGYESCPNDWMSVAPDCLVVQIETDAMPMSGVMHLAPDWGLIYWEADGDSEPRWELLEALWSPG